MLRQLPDRLFGGGNLSCVCGANSGCVCAWGWSATITSLPLKKARRSTGSIRAGPGSGLMRPVLMLTLPPGEMSPPPSDLSPPSTCYISWRWWQRSTLAFGPNLLVLNVRRKSFLQWRKCLVVCQAGKILGQSNCRFAKHCPKTQSRLWACKQSTWGETLIKCDKVIKGIRPLIMKWSYANQL